MGIGPIDEHRLQNICSILPSMYGARQALNEGIWQPGRATCQPGPIATRQVAIHSRPGEQNLQAGWAKPGRWGVESEALKRPWLRITYPFTNAQVGLASPQG